jgi:hypothetical protein
VIAQSAVECVTKLARKKPSRRWDCWPPLDCWKMTGRSSMCCWLSWWFLNLGGQHAGRRVVTKREGRLWGTSASQIEQMKGK